ncbi:Outer membrane protein beta-barrel domain-containing protein [Tenacibaculum sp. 190130A14a]|uniref:Outer membrane protein beta-barrel domain-containing protein n=1 Tax=Tenacibaculum polynesiense TaxID=3137857 RepID=A0ABP1F3L2_9FLAO
MRKFVLLLLFLGASQVAFSQIHFGIKGGINYNSDTFVEVKDDVLSGAKSKAGFHGGFWLRAKIPAIGLYIRPELIYTKLSSETTYKQSNGAPTPVFQNKSVTYDLQKIDIPVLIGKKFLKIAHVFAGPSFQYILSSDFNLSDLSEVKSDGFSLGLQLGAGIELGKLGLDVRWERALNDTETSFVNNNVSQNVNFDTRVNQIIIGLSYRF